MVDETLKSIDDKINDAKQVVEDLVKLKDEYYRLIIGTKSNGSNKTDSPETKVLTPLLLTKLIVDLLKKENRFLHAREIKKMISNDFGYSIKTITDKMGNAMSGFKKINGTTKHSVKNSNINTFWGFSKWMGENNEPLPEHMYNTDELDFKKDKQEIII